MKKVFGTWQLAGFATVSVLGTLLHFLYDWANSKAVALFSGVNESTWEHMKILFFPMLLFAVVQRWGEGKDYGNFWCIKLRSTLVGLTLIPVIFYTLRGSFGTTPDWVNIGIFFIAAGAAYAVETKAFGKGPKPGPACGWALLMLCFIAIAFWVCTFLPPEIPLFQDPTTGTYGIQM